MTMFHRWSVRFALAAAVLVWQGVPAEAGSLSPRAYRDGVNAYTQHFECIFGGEELLTGAYTGYYGTSDVTWPRVNDVYYGHVVVSTLGNPCAGPYINIEMYPPPNTQLALSAQDRIYCFYYPVGGGVTEITPAGGCPQNPGIGPNGGYVLNPTLNPFAWPLAQGAFIEVQFPLRSSQPMSGIATNSYLTARVQAIAGTSPVSFPQQGVFVAPDDLIFKDGFSAGHLGAWSSSLIDGGDLYVSSSAAMRTGTGYGLVANVDDTNSLFVQNASPNNQSRYRMRFYLHPNTFDPGVALGHLRTRVFLALDETPNTRRVLAIVLKRQAGQYSLAVRVRRDDGVQVDTAFHTISAAAHAVEIDWARATGPGHNNGTLRLWIDDVLKQTLSGIDNDTAGIDSVRMGALSVKGGAGGALLFDEMESRSATAVGP